MITDTVTLYSVKLYSGHRWGRNIERCPHFISGVKMYTILIFGTAQAILIIYRRVPLFQIVLIRGFYCTLITTTFRGQGGPLSPLGELLSPLDFVKLIHRIPLCPPTFWKHSVCPSSHIICVQHC